MKQNDAAQEVLPGFKINNALAQQVVANFYQGVKLFLAKEVIPEPSAKIKMKCFPLFFLLLDIFQKNLKISNIPLFASAKAFNFLCLHF